MTTKEVLNQAADRQAEQCEKFLKQGQLKNWIQANKALVLLEERIKNL